MGWEEIPSWAWNVGSPVSALVVVFFMMMTGKLRSGKMVDKELARMEREVNKWESLCATLLANQKQLVPPVKVASDVIRAMPTGQESTGDGT